MSDEFLDKVMAQFEAGKYADAIQEWGIDTSNSHDFKQKAYADYTFREKDVIVTTYPKSGTTWMKQIAVQIGYRGDGEYKHIDDVVPWPDKLVPIEGPELNDLSVLSDSPTGIHVIKSHLEAAYVPVDTGVKCICVIRDPKDTLVSVVHFENGFNKLLFNHTIPVDEWVAAFQTDRFIYQPWALLTDSWWRLRDRSNVLVMFYEDMKKDPQGCINQVAEFLQVELTEEQFNKVLEKSSFSYMKANDEKFAPPAWDAGHVPMVRSGESGNSKELLSEEAQAQIDAFCLQELDKLSSDFPYRERYVKG
jgi:hypothetical protein